ncbi:hypothetical protein ABK040_008025 [Willaertia magna]
MKSVLKLFNKSNQNYKLVQNLTIKQYRFKHIFRDGTTSNLFSFSEFQQALKTKYIGRCFIYRLETSSTMDIAKREAEENCPTGTLVLAENQTKGRGRKGRSWSSKGVGNDLYFSVIYHVKPENPLELLKLNLSVPVAVVLAIKEEGAKDVGIKWPNDIWYWPNPKENAQKICGMLVDTNQIGNSISACSGVGINVNQSIKFENIIDSHDSNLKNVAISVSDILQRKVNRELFLASICNKLEVLLSYSFEHIMSMYHEHDILYGKEITIYPLDTQNKPYPAKAKGISKYGNLLVELLDGTGIKELIAEEVSIRPQKQ